MRITSSKIHTDISFVYHRYHEVQKHNMQRGDVRSAPRVFPWTLYPPAVLKIHMFTPVYNPQGKRIGGFNVGFKVHWLSQFLSGLRMDGDCMSQGCFCFIVERETGHLVATSDPSIKVLTNEDTTNGEPINPIKALESSDIRVAAIAKEVVDANGGDWMDVHSFKSRSDVEVDASLVNLALERMAVSKPFIMTSDFKRMSSEPMNSTVTDVPFGIDWIILLSVPEKVVMDSINDKKAKNAGILVGYSAGLWVVEQFILPLLIVVLAGAYVAWSKSKNSTPPSSKENEEEV